MITIEEIEKYIQKYKAEHGYAPVKATIAKAKGVTHRAISYHFEENEKVLGKYDEYKRYYSARKTKRAAKAKKAKR